MTFRRLFKKIVLICNSLMYSTVIVRISAFSSLSSDFYANKVISNLIKHALS